MGVVTVAIHFQLSHHFAIVLAVPASGLVCSTVQYGTRIFIGASRVSVPPTRSRQPSHLAAAPAALALLPLARARPVAGPFFAALALGLRGREQVVGRAARARLVRARARFRARARDRDRF